MSFAPQPSAAPATAAAAAQHHIQPPTPMPAAAPSHATGANAASSHGANAAGRTAQMTSHFLPNLRGGASPATAGGPGVAGQTGAPARPVVKMKRTGNQGPFPVSAPSSTSKPHAPSLGSGVNSNPQNPQNPPNAASPSFSPANRNRPPSHARQSHPGINVTRISTGLGGILRLSSSASLSPDLDPKASSGPGMGYDRPYHSQAKSTDRPRRGPSKSQREISPNSSRESSPDKPLNPNPVQEPLPSSTAALGRDTPRNANHTEMSAFEVGPSPFRNSGRTARKGEPQAEQSSLATPGVPSPAAPAINPKTNRVYTYRDALDDGEYKHYLQTDDPPDADSSTRGVLIPDKYRKSNDAEYPWICPVRSCRSKHMALGGLGTHFLNTHRGKCFNDNLDGTLTDLGEYQAGSGNPSRPAIIVSKRPMTLDESPFAPAWRREKHRSVGRPKRKRKTWSKTPSLVEDSDAPGLSDVTSSSSGSESGGEGTRILTMANPDRAYNQWMGKRYGVLLPDDYTMHTRLPDRPYICPVRSCRHLHKSVSDLSIHWERAHLGRYLNDNLDGTFTVVGDRKKLHKPAVVISKTPNDSDPVAAPKYPTYTTGKNTVWVDLADEDAVIDQNTSVSDNIPGSRIRVPRAVASISGVAQPQTKKTQPEEPPPHSKTKRAQGTPDEVIHVSEPTSPIPATIYSDVGIVNTKSGRPYASWTDPETGTVKSLNSVVIPDGYRLLTDEFPTRPFVCPIRTCRRLCKTLHGLLAHFGLAHPKDALNDNGDGTLSIVGRSQGKSCIVVSQNPLGRDEPMVDPTFPEYSKPFYERERANHQPSGKTSARPSPVDNSMLEADDEFDDSDVPDGDVPDDASALPSSKPTAEADPARTSDVGDLQGTWSYLCSELGKEYPPTTTGCTEVLLQLPPARSLDLRRPLKIHLNSQQLNATLIQLVGEEFPKAPCTQCRMGTGPFQSCVRAKVAIAEQLHPHLKSQKLACANCLFAKRANSCSVRYSGVRYNGATWLLPNMAAPVAKPAEGSKSSEPRSRQLDEEIPATSSSEENYSENRNLLKRRRSARARHVVGEPDPKRRVVTMAVQADELGVTTPAPASGVPTPVQAQAPASGAIASGVNPAAMQDVLEMEDWEMEEGQIPAANPSTSGQNLATHISIGQTVQLFKDVTLSTKVISSGGAFSFTPDSNKTRVCVVISGKLKAQVGDEKEFVIGQRGMFRIGPGVKCLIVNTSYLDAMLQVTSMTD